MQKIKTEFLSNEIMRLDIFVAAVADISRSRASQLIDEGFVLVNNKTSSKNLKLKMGDVVEIEIPEPKSYDVKPQNIPIDIFYEDSYLLIVNKPKGMVVHPAAGNYEGTLVNALMYHCGDSLSSINGIMRPGIVHRIDKNTSGLLIVAKNDLAHHYLAEQIKEHSFTREYAAVVYGSVKSDFGTINAPIARDRYDRKRMAVIPNGKNAITHYEVVERLKGFTYLKLKLETGRTHQIRVHMAHIGYPVAGDDVYGPKKVITELNGQCLHAKKIGFIHPITKEYLEFESNLPDYFEKFLRGKK